MLHFHYGTMGSGKTMDLLKVRYNYIESHLTTITAVPCDGTPRIESRAMDESVLADFAIAKDDDIGALLKSVKTPIDGVFIDDSQFLTINQVRELRDYADKHPYCEIFCYGLLTTIENEMWEASKELMMLAHTKEELHSRCQKCGKRYASHHLKTKGSQWNDKSQYQAVCYECWQANQNEKERE